MVAVVFGVELVACSGGGATPDPGTGCYVGDQVDQSLVAPIATAEPLYRRDAGGRVVALYFTWEDKSDVETCYVLTTSEHVSVRPVTLPPVVLPADSERYEYMLDERGLGKSYVWRLYAASATGRSEIVTVSLTVPLP